MSWTASRSSHGGAPRSSRRRGIEASFRGGAPPSKSPNPAPEGACAITACCSPGWRTHLASAVAASTAWNRSSGQPSATCCSAHAGTVSHWREGPAPRPHGTAGASYA